ncbi:flagellar hook-length control protein FliK [Rhodopseudomonas sp. RCAM05734]|uniref:flagellar hook-length control protein FliK n=1 Tax=Rhodopseudomonas sp. RCAM05734 TaxID=3457549 RepID=UPI004043E504
MSLVVNPVSPVIAIPGVSNVVMQPGSVITARVLQVLGADQARISIGGQSLDVQTQVPLQAGQSLQLAVSQTSDGIRLAVVNQQALPAPANAASGDVVTLAPDAAHSIAAQAPSILLVKSPLTPQEALAVTTATQIAATQQASLAPLFANLGAAGGLQNLPPQLQQAMARLLAQRPNLDPNLTGAAVQQAFEKSGLFLEASLASGAAPSASTPDLKASLIVLRQVLTATLGNMATAPATAPMQQGAQGIAAAVPQGVAADVVLNGQTAFLLAMQTADAPIATSLPAAQTAASPAPNAAAEIPAEVAGHTAPVQVILTPPTPAESAARAAAGSAALTLLQEAVQANPAFAASAGKAGLSDSLMLSLLPAVTGMRTQKVDDSATVHTNIPPPPLRGALPTAQPVMPATIVANAPPETTLRHLLADTDAALARQTLMQVASLPDRGDASSMRIDPASPRWSFEIPFAMPQGTAIAQFEISRDGGNDNPTEAAQQVWRARFSLDVEPAGPVHALVSLQGDKTSVRMWAERPATAQQLRDGASQLNQALVRAELHPGDIVIRDGAPPSQPAPASAGHFLDRAL